MAIDIVARAIAIKSANEEKETIQKISDQVELMYGGIPGEDPNPDIEQNKSIRQIAREELITQLIPEDAKEAYDTLQEIAAWIQSHPDDAAAMNKEIQDLKKTLVGFGEGTDYPYLKNYIDEVSYIPVISNEQIDELFADHEE